MTIRSKNFAAAFAALAIAAFAAAVCGCRSPGGAQSPDAAAETRRNAKLHFARRLAADGCVLLENRDAALPLASGDTVALAGRSAYGPLPCLADDERPEGRRGTALSAALEAAGVNLAAPFAKFYSANPDAEPDAAAFAKLAEGMPRSVKCVVSIFRRPSMLRDMTDSRGSFRMTREEERLVESACKAFECVVVVLAAPGPFDTSFMDDGRVKALLFVPPAGETAGNAVADLLAGRVNPSGKTADTWPRRYSDCGSTDCFGNLEVPFREESDVGYRHFDDTDTPPRYAFGHGLSYTTFEISYSAKVQKTRVFVDAAVRNTGKRAGRETVQAFAGRDLRVRGREPYRVHCAFAKTPLLEPGESTHVSLDIELKDFAIYDETAESWILPGGRYRIWAGGTPATLVEAATATFGDMVVAPAAARFGDSRTGLRLRGRGDEPPEGEHPPIFKEVLEGAATPRSLAAWLSVPELGRALSRTGGSLLSGLEGFGIPDLPVAENPQCAEPSDPAAVVWPCPLALAQCRDTRAARYFGRVFADDLEICGKRVWCGLRLDIHRNPLAGGNFASLSEDPFLAGAVGAEIVNGLQKNKDGSSTGRFAAVAGLGGACQRSHSGEAMADVSEKALREVYFKPFETVVRRASPAIVMLSGDSSADGIPSCADSRLSEGLLRDDWGYTGVVLPEHSAAAPSNRGFLRRAAAGLISIAARSAGEASSR